MEDDRDRELHGRGPDIEAEILILFYIAIRKTRSGVEDRNK